MSNAQITNPGVVPPNLVPPPGYYRDTQTGEVRPIPKAPSPKPERQYKRVYNNEWLARKYRNEGYIVRHIKPEEPEFL